MGFDLRRLRSGEVVALAGTLLMLVALFGVTWYGGATARTGWQGTTHVRWLLVVAAAFGLAITATQAACRDPALPASLDVLSVVVALIAVLWLIYRVIISAAPHQRAGAWLELLGSVLLLAGSFLALRQEGILERDGPGEIELVQLPGLTSPAPSPPRS